MGAAKKIVQLERKAKKVELTEVVKEKPSKAPKVSSFSDFAGLAQSLTREKSKTHDEVEAVLQSKAEAVDVMTDTSFAPLAAEPVQEVTDSTEAVALPETPRRDMSKVALFASIAAVILLLGFYFHLNQNIKHLTQQVHDLGSLKSSVTTLDTKVGTMESKVADLETLPAKTRAALMSSILHEMTEKTSYMSTQLESVEQQEKLMRAKELIQQVQTELNTTK